MNGFWNKFLTSNDTSMRLLRTIVQGLLGVVIANVDLFIGSFTIDPAMKAVLVAMVMSVLSPVMALIGESSNSHKEEHDNNEPQ